MFQSSNENALFLRSAVLIVGILLAVSFFSEADTVFAYKSDGKRDPFVPLIGVSARSTAGGLRGVISVEELFLQGVVVGTDGERAAIINGEILKKGDSIGRLSIIEINDGSAIIDFNNKKHTLKMFE